MDKSVRRGELIGYISSNPGASFSTIRQDLGMGNGQLSEHLSKLERTLYIKSKQIGIRKCFFPRNFDLSRIPPESGHPIQEKIVDVLKKNPGLNQKEMAGILGLPRKTIGYHLNSLVLNARIRIEKHGREKRHYLADRKPGSAGLDDQGGNGKVQDQRKPLTAGGRENGGKEG